MSFYSFSRIRFPFPNRRIAIIAVGLLTAAIAFLDWLIVPNVSLGLLYFLPILLAAHLAPREIAAFALVSTVLREQFGPSQWGEPSLRAGTRRLLFRGRPGTGRPAIHGVRGENR